MLGLKNTGGEPDTYWIKKQAVNWTHIKLKQGGEPDKYWT